MPKEAKVAVFEDDNIWQQRIRELLEEGGHTIVVQEGTLKEALESLERFRELGVNAVVLGGALDCGEKDPNSPENDSQIILLEMGKRGMEIGTVGLSGLSVPRATVDLGKRHASALSAVVDSLLSRLSQ